MKAIPNSRFRSAACRVLAAAIFLVIAAAPVMASPVVVQIIPNTADGMLKGVALSGTGAAPYSTTDTTLTDIGTNTGIRYNNMGWRSRDGLLYALELDDSGSTGNMLTISPSTGLVTATTAISGGTASLTTGIAYDAGDVNNTADVLYISRLASDSNLYIADLTHSTFALSAQTITNHNTGYVADWAYSPKTGNLHGMDLDGDWATIDLSTWTRTDSPAAIAASDYYGAAWYDPATQDIFVYRNSAGADEAAIYQVDPSTGAVQKSYGAAATTLHDGAYAVPIPAAAWLLGSGLIWLVAIPRKKRA